MYKRTYDRGVGYEWDPEKARRNQTKHGVSFCEAPGVLEDDLALTARDPNSRREERFVTVGEDSIGRILVVVYTFREDRVRVISARKATFRERRQYEDGQ